MAYDLKYPSCDICWPEGKVDVEHCQLTVRGKWLSHQFVYCDVRKIFLCPTAGEEGGHCTCDGHELPEIQKNDNLTNTYGGYEHHVNDLEKCTLHPFDFIEDIIKVVKDNKGKITKKQEFEWIITLLAGGVTSYQSGIKLNLLGVAFISSCQIEIADDYKSWLAARNVTLKYMKQANFGDQIELKAMTIRSVSEWVCGRALFRITQGNSVNVAPLNIENEAETDPLIVQTVGGSWVGGFYNCLHESNTNNVKLSINYSGWIDHLSCTLNSWGSVHRDLTDKTPNNVVFYYSKSPLGLMSNDLFEIIDGSLHKSGPYSRAALLHLDGIDQVGRYKMLENYWHCKAKCKESTKLNNRLIKYSLPERLTKLFGGCYIENNTTDDVISYTLTKAKPKYKNTDQHKSDSNNICSCESTSQSIIENSEYRKGLDVLLKGMIATLSNSCQTHNQFKVFSELLNPMLNLQKTSLIASNNHDHKTITMLNKQYRDLKIPYWSLELNNELPMGGVMVMNYIVMIWFLENMEDVDYGFRSLRDSNYVF